MVIDYLLTSLFIFSLMIEVKEDSDYLSSEAISSNLAFIFLGKFAYFLVEQR